MKSLVIYKSISGYTKKYAEWISKDLKADLAEFNKVSLGSILEHDQIIFGGRIIASGIDGINIIKKNLGRFGNRRIIVFAVGAGPAKKDVVKSIRDKNFTPEEQKNIEFFYLRGGFDFNKLGFFDRFIMNIMKHMLQSKKEKTEDQKRMLDSYEHPTDFSKKEYLKELLAHAKRK